MHTPKLCSVFKQCLAIAPRHGAEWKEDGLGLECGLDRLNIERVEIRHNGRESQPLVHILPIHQEATELICYQPSPPHHVLTHTKHYTPRPTCSFLLPAYRLTSPTYLARLSTSAFHLLFCHFDDSDSVPPGRHTLDQSYPHTSDPTQLRSWADCMLLCHS